MSHVSKPKIRGNEMVRKATLILGLAAFQTCFAQSSDGQKTGMFSPPVETGHLQ